MKKLSMIKYSSSKAQINVDLIMSYILFVFFLIFLFQFIINLTIPFSNSVIKSRENQVMEILRSTIDERMTLSDIADSCIFYHEAIESIKTEFTITGFPLPEDDISYTLPNQTQGSLVFYRDGNKLSIIAGTEYSEKNISILLVFPENTHASLSLLTNETNDQVDFVKDFFGNRLLDLILRINSTDEDRINVLTENEGIVVISSLSGIDEEDVYVGTVPLKNNCGVSSGGYSSSLIGFTSVLKDQKIFPSEYKINVWWFK